MTTTIPAPLCLFCKHLGEGTRCAAFPGGIPDEILFGEVEHDAPFPGDHGIRFELKPGEKEHFEEWCRLAAASFGSCGYRSE